jgi:hypothetical protein
LKEKRASTHMLPVTKPDSSSSGGDKDFAVKISVRNGRLLRAIREAGFKTLADFTRAVGCQYGSFQHLLAFKRTPLLRTGEWSDLAQDIAVVLRCRPEDLWPEYLREVRLRQSSREVDMSLEEVREIAAPRETLVDRERMEGLLEPLDPRSRQVVTLLYGLDGEDEHSRQQVASLLSVSPCRIHQLEARAIRRMRQRAIFNRWDFKSVTDES